jgi:hypothetical protein
MKQRKKVPARKRQREVRRKTVAMADAAAVAPAPRKAKTRVVQFCDCKHEVNAHSSLKFGGGCIMCECPLSKEACL